MLNNITHPSSIAFYLWYVLPPLVLFHSLIMYISAQWRFVHFHGQKTSRQSRKKSIYKDVDHKRTKPFRVLTVILFFIPDAYLRELKEVSVDDIIVEEVWRNLTIKLVSEWMDFVLYVSCALISKEAPF
jgi:hypothetical protein